MKRLLCRLTREVDAVGQKTGRHAKRLGQLFDGVEVGDSLAAFELGRGISRHGNGLGQRGTTEVGGFAQPRETERKTKVKGILATTDHGPR